MKYYLPLLISFFPFLLSAQEGMFDHPKSEWYLAHSYVNPNSGSPAFVETRSTLFTLDGDSVISGERWLKIFTRLNDSSGSESVPAGLLRTYGDLVLYKGIDGSVDTLYNFGLEVGDRFTFKFQTDTIQAEVLKVEVLDGRRHIYFGEPENTSLIGVMNEVWIEGIGSIHGPLYPCAPRMFMTEFTDALDLTCARKGGAEVWKSENYDDCFIENILGTRGDSPEIPFSVYPNPFEQYIYLEGPFMGGSGAEVSVYDMQGRKVHNSQLPVGKRQLSLNELKRGVYLLEIAWEGESYFRKIVK